MPTIRGDEEEPKGKEYDLHPPHGKRIPFKKWFIAALIMVLATVVVIGSYAYLVSPAGIRNPRMEHYHFRMQLIVDGRAMDFGKGVFQTPYAKGQCSADLAVEPIHFHDQKDQFVHIHWDGMTGGLVLKNYGWNFVGGADSRLGYRLDELPRIKSVPIFGNILGQEPDSAEFWVYTGDGNSYQKRSFDDFLKKDIEQFFNKESNFPKPTSLMNKLFPKAYAHGTESHDETLSADEEERLQRLNNLIGNVVIFVQKSEPSAESIKARFADLEPLSESTCAG